MAGRETTEKHTFLITVIIVAVVLVVVGTFTFLSYQNYTDLTARKRAKDKLIDDHDKVIALKQEKENELKQSEARFENVKKYLPDTKSLDLLLDAFSTKCIESKLKLTKLEKETRMAGPVRGAAVRQDVEKIQFKGEFTGTFHSLAKFVSMVEDWEHFKRFVSITQFKMKADKKGVAFDTGLQLHTVAMTFELYKYEEPKQTPPMVPPPGVRPVGTR